MNTLNKTLNQKYLRIFFPSPVYKINSLKKNVLLQRIFIGFAFNAVMCEILKEFFGCH